MADSGAQPGDVIHLYRGSDPVVAVVVKQEKKKLRLTAASGETFLASNPRGWLTLARGAPPKDEAQAHAKAEAMERLVRDLEARVDVETLWDLLVDDGGTYLPEELAELALERTDPPAVAATRRAVLGDRLRFKQKKDRFEPIRRRVVEETIRQREVAAERERRRERGIAALEEALGSGEDLDLDEHRELVALLEGLAVHGMDYPRAAAASRLLTELGVGTREPAIKAFEVLVRLGVFHPHENLPARRAGIPMRFRGELVREARELMRVTPWEDPSRVDLTGLLTVAIDDPETTEVDDALSLSPSPSGGWTMWVHIADPGSVVPVDSPLMAEAARRAASLYLPEGKVTMFPPELASGPMSLNQGEPRAALTLKAELTPGGEVRAYEFLLSKVMVDHQVSYEEADRLLEQTGPLGDLLHHLVQAGDALESMRRANGAIMLNGPEFKIRRHEDGRVTIVPMDRLSPSRAMVAEAMILVGTCAGRTFVDRGAPASFRCQDPPDEDLDLPDGPLDPLTFYLAVKRIHRAEISRIPGRHAGLGVDAYVQISSPIRRYGDLVMQRQLKSLIEQGHPVLTEDELLDEVSQVENLASVLANIERERKRYWTLYYLSGHKGERTRAMLLERRRPGHFLVELLDTGLRANMDVPDTLPPGAVVEAEIGPADPLRDRISLRFLREVE